MAIDRRTLFLGAGLAGIAGPSLFAAAGAQAPAPATPPSGRTERIAAAAREHQLLLTHADGQFAGPGWERLVECGRAAHFFMIGEEHGIAENPKLAAALFRSLAPSGYARLAIEISDPMARAVDRAVTAGGLEGIQRLYADPASRVAFFGLREEAELLAAVRDALPGRAPFLWGLDYEVGADRHLIATLKAMRKPAAAQAAVAALERASQASWERYEATRNPQFIYSFAGDPALVRAVRAAWPRAGEEARLILGTLEETFEINRLFVSGQGWESNERRGRLMRGNFLRLWRAERRKPRVMLKFGAGHMTRGISPTGTWDIGTLVPEVAAMDDVGTFSLLVLADPASETSNLDPTTFRYVPGRREQYQAGLEVFTGQPLAGGFALFDTRPLRRLARTGDRSLHPELVRTIHGFDAVLVMTGSTPAANL